MLKFALPVAAVVIAGAFAAYSYLSVPGSITFDMSESGYVDGKFVMANPKLDGYTQDNQPYRMAAKRALQHVKDSGVIELEGIDARLPIGSEKFATVGAERGIYNNDKSTLDIPSPITVETTDGMIATLQSAYLDIRKGILDSKAPVSVKMDGVELSSRAMRVVDHGKIMIFYRRVKMVVAPSRIRHESAGTEQPAADAAQN